MLPTQQPLGCFLPLHCFIFAYFLFQWRKQDIALLRASTTNCQVHPWQHNNGQATPRIRARMVKSAPGEKHLHKPQQQPLCPICQSSPLMWQVVSPSPGGKKLQISAACRGHLSKDSLPQLRGLNKNCSKDRISLQYFEWPHKGHGQKPSHTVTVAINLRFIAKYA